MTKIADPKYRLVRHLGLAAAAVLMLLAAPAQRAEALSLINPGGVFTAKYASEALVTEVRGGRGGGGHRGGFRGGGHRGGFHGGGFRGFRGGFHRGGFHRGGLRFIGPQFHRRHFGPRFYAAPVYYGARCRIVWTYYGPRRICKHRWHHRHHRWHRRWW
jgi:hypothetical protein